jgi:hypothetical protein
MPKKKSGYPQTIDGTWQYPTMPVSFVSCCDCGLVHKHVYQITPDDFAVRDSKGKWRYGRRIRVKVSRDRRKTAQIRRGLVGQKKLFKTRDGWYVAAFPVIDRRMYKRRKPK